jgi:hypothetical protein
MLRQDDFLKGQLVMYGWRAGHKYGGHLASTAIMNVIANRVKLGWGSWLEVIHDMPLKSAIVEKSDEMPLLWDPVFIKLLHAVEGVFDSSSPDLSNGAVYFVDLAEPVTNPWFQEKILDHLEIHRRVADLNSLTFFV